jgi:LysM repeat protein
MRGRRGWLLLPLIGLIPVVAAVLASEWPFGGGQFGSPRVAAPAPTILVTLATATPAPVLTTQAIAAPPLATSAPTPGSASAAAAAPTAASGGAGAAGLATTPARPAAATSQPATATSASAQSASGSGLYTAYRVQPGDTVKFVAQMYGVTPASVVNASGLQNPDRLQVGQVLTIPKKSGWLYRVQPGETLDQIAARTGVSSDAIATVSHLTAASVRAGDVILVPDLAPATSK